jgi:hypothetical protein
MSLLMTMLSSFFRDRTNIETFLGGPTEKLAKTLGLHRRSVPPTATMAENRQDAVSRHL